MITIELFLEGEGAFKDIKGDISIIAMGSRRWRLALLDQGTLDGKPTVTLGIQLDDGKWMVAETSLAALGAAVEAMQAQAKMNAEYRSALN